jgi:AraC-like DNA-binding protein
MTVGIKEMIARCIERMRQKECARCDNRKVCPAGRWQAMFSEFERPRREPEHPSPFIAFLGELAGAIERGAARQQSSFRRDVETVVGPLLAEGDANIDRVAREMGLSRQTLYRRLKAEGVTFEQLLDELRHSLALKLLRDRQMPVKQAAWRLGFSDPAAFSRAFKRWTGTAPSFARPV